MSIIFDIILVVLFLFTLIRHYRLGLACSILSAGRILVSLFAAALLCYPIALVMYNIGIPEAFSGIAAFIVIFIAAMILSKLIIKLISKIKIPLVTKIDKLLGLLLGFVLGAIYVSLLSTAAYTVIELISSISSDGDVMNVYNDSYVFKAIYDLKIFEFIRNLF